MMRLALVVYTNNHVKNIKVSNDSGMLHTNTKKTNNNKGIHHFSSTSNKFVFLAFLSKKTLASVL